MQFFFRGKDKYERKYLSKNNTPAAACCVRSVCCFRLSDLEMGLHLEWRLWKCEVWQEMKRSVPTVHHSFPLKQQNGILFRFSVALVEVYYMNTCEQTEIEILFARWFSAVGDVQANSRKFLSTPAVSAQSAQSAVQRHPIPHHCGTQSPKAVLYSFIHSFKMQPPAAQD